MACTRRVRRLNSSIKVSIFRRRRMNRLRASCRSLRRRPPAQQQAEILLVLLHQVGERVQVVRHPGDDLLLGEPLGQRDLDRAVEGQRALVDLDQRADRRPHRHVAADHRAAEPLPRDLDLLGQRDLFRAGQQRNLGHLAQIHADRIAAELRRLRRAAAADRPARWALRPSPAARRWPRSSSDRSAAS